MRVVRDLALCPHPPQGTAVTIGAYDGVHRGHLVVIEQVKRVAAERSLTTAVVTFDRHPAMVVRPESAPKVLTDLDQKLELLATTGLTYAVVVPFNEKRMREPAEDFVTEVLVGCLAVKCIVVGEDFHFGHERRGNVALLRQMGAQLGFDVVGLDLVGIDGRLAAPDDRVSSTAIRRALADGDVAAANRLLGRAYEVRGRVAATNASTVTVSVPAEVQLPAPGRYRGWYERPDRPLYEAAVDVSEPGKVLVELTGETPEVPAGEPAKLGFRELA